MCKVLADGYSYYTRSGVACGGAQLILANDGRVKPLQCERRTMISQPATGMRNDALVFPYQLFVSVLLHSARCGHYHARCYRQDPRL